MANGSASDATAAAYRAAREQVALFDRSDRGVIVVTGKDRRPWLHNLVTNAVRTLADCQGVYAFAVNVQGRILFDANVLSLPDALWLDVDLTAVPAALAHLERYLITEDVTLTDASAALARLGCAGPLAAALAAEIGVVDLARLPALSVVALDAERTYAVRNDFAGEIGFELFVPRSASAAWRDRLVEAGAVPAGRDVLDVLRIEAGIPWYGRELDAQVLPPETGPGARGISYDKGCYLGQEVLERMRSRDVLARRLVRLRTGSDVELSLPADLLCEGRRVGRLTSLVRHPLESWCVGLGYISTSLTPSAALATGNPPRDVVILP
ncbi:MAG: hypothetical protein PVJ57_20485 [Phycisphaerae bacterium]|jgi:folate-binding protein YgfZ